MKYSKKTTILIVLLSLFAFSSCVKQRTCVCKDATGIPFITLQDTDTKKRFKKHCENGELLSKGMGGQPAVSPDCHVVE